MERGLVNFTPPLNVPGEGVRSKTLNEGSTKGFVAARSSRAFAVDFRRPLNGFGNFGIVVAEITVVPGFEGCNTRLGGSGSLVNCQAVVLKCKCLAVWYRVKLKVQLTTYSR